MRYIIIFWAIMVVSAASPARASHDIFHLSLDELSAAKVTSLSKVSESAFESAAAVYIITQEDIKHMGVTSIPEALRVVPGIEVARISASKWAVTARGFNSQLANKLLVLMDGRVVYNSYFSGVYWDMQDTVLEDIDRIEVIRGPGTAIWGTNAVNGVINIITKHARNTQGNYVSFLAGDREETIAQARHGGMINDDIFYRTFVKYSDRDNFRELDGSNAFDDWSVGRGGFRVDWDKTSQQSLSFQGDIYRGKEDENRTLLFPSLTPPYVNMMEDGNGGELSGANLMMKWENTLSSTSSLQFQAYVDASQRDYDDLGQKQNTFDMDMQYHWQPHTRHEVIAGSGIRYIYQSIDESQFFQHSNDHRYDTLYSMFLQDKIALIPDKVFLTLGTKFEYNAYTDLEYQPNARIAWLVSDSQTLWGGISRAVRTPNYVEHSFDTIVGVLPANQVAPDTQAGFIKWRGNPRLESEELLAYELGYRIKPLRTLYVDITGYYHDFDSLVTTEGGSFFPEPDTARILTFDNKAYGEVMGVEAGVHWDVRPNWQLIASYGLVNMSLHLDEDSNDVLQEPIEGDSPKNTMSLRSYWNVTDQLSVTNIVYFVDNLVTADIPSYTRFDTSIVWRFMDGFETGLVGQNLFDGEHREFSSSFFASSTEIPRSVFGYVAWHF